MTLEETRKWIVANVDENTRRRDYGGGMTDEELTALQDSMRRMDHETQISKLYNYEQQVAQVNTVRDTVSQAGMLTPFEQRCRETSMRDFDRLRSINGIGVRSLREMREAISHDLHIIESMPSTPNLVWEHRRKAILIGMIEERVRTEEFRRMDYVPDEQRDMNYASYEEYYTEDMRREVAQIIRLINTDSDNVRARPGRPKKLNPLHSIAPLPRKMILDRS